MTTIALAIYAVGFVIGLIAIDARGPARVGLALLWPLGPLAMVVTGTILLLASLIAFPIFGAIVVALAVVVAAIALRSCS